MELMNLQDGLQDIIIQNAKNCFLTVNMPGINGLYLYGLYE